MLTFMILVQILEVNNETGEIDVDMDLIEVNADSEKHIKDVLERDFNVQTEYVIRAYQLLDVVGCIAD